MNKEEIRRMIREELRDMLLVMGSEAQQRMERGGVDGAAANCVDNLCEMTVIRMDEVDRDRPRR